MQLRNSNNIITSIKGRSNRRKGYIVRLLRQCEVALSILAVSQTISKKIFLTSRLLAKFIFICYLCKEIE